MLCGDKKNTFGKLQLTGWLACGELSWCFSSLELCHSAPTFAGAA